jgi:hypothetical protein
VSNSPALPSKSRSHADAGVRAPSSLRQVPPAWEGIRSVSRLAGCSPPPSLAFAHVAARGSFEDSPIGSCTGTRMMVRATLLTLAPSPTHPGPCGPAVHRASSLGVVQRSPLHRTKPWSPLPGDGPERARSVSPSLRDGNAGSHPRSALVVSHHLDGFLLRDPAAMLQAAADPGVHRVSSRRETEFPAMRLLPSEAFPPPTASGRETMSPAPGARHRRDRLRPLRSPRTLPPRPFACCRQRR